jgi:hypothetical protein
LPSQSPKPAPHTIEHAPPPQEGVPLIAAQTIPQPPQCATFEPVLVSQPLDRFMSQSAKPALHAPMVQRPPAHAGVALANEHALPHAPQLAADVLRLVSQPLAALPSQLPNPALHVPMPQRPAVHTPVALAGAHATPHPPQCARAVVTLVSQPLAALPSQSPKPALQASPHAPDMHVAEALAGAGHTLPQRPQLLTSDASKTQRPAHIVVGDMHTVVHVGVAPEHTWPVAHARPHAPQWAVLVRVSVSQPLAALPSQSANPARHDAIVHVPPAHAAVALGRLHARPHIPQLVAVVRVSTSQPFAGFPSQSAKPALHAAMVHAPAAHAAVALASEHVRPHIPQCTALMPRLTSQPLAALPSQLPKPALHDATVHMLAAHAAVALASEHARPHIPQCAAVVARFTSHPSAGLALQSPKPALQTVVQRPTMHVAVAFCARHTLPQTPQLVALVRTSVSQPFAGLLSQSAKPALQLATEHIPPAHAAVALGRLHARPHIPQLVAVVRVSVSQPLAALPSQSAKPALQAPITQRPAEHAGVALAAAQVVPQAPQLVAVLVRAVSQPLALLPSQLPKPALQVIPHAPIAHVAVPFAGTAHARPQPPQCAVEVLTFTHAPLQSVCPVGQLDTHAPAAHTRPPVQALPQRPQCAPLARVSVSQPLAAFMSQSAKLGRHSEPQRPAAQVAREFGGTGHALPHAPQLVGSVAVTASQPFVAAPSQLPKPALQVSPHAPSLQAAVALAPPGQRTPQSRQFIGSRKSSASQPLAGFMSQLPWRVGSVHITSHRPPTQRPWPLAPDGHAVPHAPQFIGSALTSTHVPPQLVARSGGHAAFAHWYESPWRVHVCPAAQRVPHAPQFIAFERSASQPLAALRSQSAKPAAHALTQRPPTHAADDMPLATQALPQLPQCRGSVASTTSQPLRTSPSQLAVPLLHTSSQARLSLQVRYGLMT